MIVWGSVRNAQTSFNQAVYPPSVIELIAISEKKIAHDDKIQKYYDHPEYLIIRQEDSTPILFLVIFVFRMF